ncbi:scopoletin glucosyltransferase-like [Rhododendron vialii]|uniref:scopoletin glucosyltransferase-like n=1 Tax=Rhododendron vialii TaxID=182163 RepID=UPI00265EA8A7|nr:scopoletin glucosyltransferase-like [Rhododendron vialii]
MDSRPHNKLHIYFLPMMAQGHMLPMVDMARLFVRRGVKATLILTPVNATLVSKTIDRDREFGFETTIRLINFPSAEVGLPEGIENQSSITSPEMSQKMLKATELLQQPFENLLEEDSPDCLVAAVFFPWASEVATKRGIPRLIFHGTGAYALSIYRELSQHKPYKNVKSDSEVFVVPGLPNKITLTRRQLPDHIRDGTESHLTKLIEKVMEAEVTSYGVVINSFHELEPAYSEHYSKATGRKVWHVGPVSLCNRDNEDKTHRGSTISINEHECLTWLDSKEPNSVLYVCFGSLSYFSNVQLLEIAMGLENSGQEFIWVVRKEKKTKEEEDREEWLPEGFEKRLEGKGFIIRGWAPQVLILDHEAVGGFMTHCGWNSMLEGMTAGVPLVAWPLFAEQFYNEKLVTDVLRVGVGVGAQEWCRWPEESKVYVKREDIEKAVVHLMVGEEAEGIRSRARALGEMAKKAIGKGGSSYNDLSALLEELELNTN